MSFVPEHIQLPMTSGKTFTANTLKNQWSILYFYPKDNTPGCTAEGKAFRDLMPLFNLCGAQVLGVSRDHIDSHEKFRTKYCLLFELISDPDEILCNQFSVLRKYLNFGKTLLGLKRTTFLINPEGEVVYKWHKVRIKNHAVEVLEVLIEKMPYLLDAQGYPVEKWQDCAIKKHVISILDDLKQKK